MNSLTARALRYAISIGGGRRQRNDHRHGLSAQHRRAHVRYDLANTQTIQHKGAYLLRIGTLRPGDDRYEYVAHSPTFGECVRLQALRSAVVIHCPFASLRHRPRTRRFTLHRRGRHGSDGCIVSLNHDERIRLKLAVRQGARGASSCRRFTRQLTPGRECGRRRPRAGARGLPRTPPVDHRVGRASQAAPGCRHLAVA